MLDLDLTNEEKNRIRYLVDYLNEELDRGNKITYKVLLEGLDAAQSLKESGEL